MASMFKKSKRNFRRKVNDSDSENENGNQNDNSMDIDDNEDTNDTPPIVVKKKEKKKKTNEKTAPSVLLSFDHEEDHDGEVFKIKKSSHSRKVAKQLKKLSKKEKEEQEKSKDKPKDTSTKPEVKVEKKENEKKSVKVEPQNGDDMDVDSESDGSGEDSKKHPSHTFRAVLARGEIPDAHLIHLARKRRQQAREMGDFIPVDDTVKVDKSKSRLIREDENDVSDDEDGRVDFTINTLAKERQQIKDDFLAAEHGSDESDHEREWEEQQIRKGVSLPQIQPQQAEAMEFSYDQYSRSSNIFNPNAPSSQFSQGPTPGHVKIPLGEGGVPPEKLPTVTVLEVKRRLIERLDTLRQVNRAHKQEKHNAEDSVENSEDNIQRLEGSVTDLEERYKFFQEMRGYVRDLVECLNHKVPAIDALEAAMLNLLKQQSEKLIKRRQEDIKDQAADFMAGKTPSAMYEDNPKQRRIAEREARRSRRKRARVDQGIINHNDGLSSDDEENPSDITKYNNEKERILLESKDIFEDVMEDFYKLNHIKKHFEEWKYKYGDSYTEAYIGLCLPKLFNPLVRADMIDWNPLKDGCPDFEEMRWYESLMFYGFREGDSLDDKDEDIKLMPSMIEKVILPKIIVLVETVWDPLSSSQSRNLVQLMQKLVADYPTVNSENKTAQNLLKAVLKRIQKCLDDDVFMPWYPKQILENKSSGAAQFFHRQFWTCVKLLGNLLMWSGILAPKPLQTLTLDSLLNRYLMLALQNSGVTSESIEKCRVISSTFPKQWFSDITSNNTIPQLEPFCRYLLHAASTLEKNSYSGKEYEKKEARELIKQIKKILVNIHAMDHAITLSNEHHI